MRVIGFGFKNISIKKDKEIDRNIEIKTDIQIHSIKKVKNDLFKNQDTLSVEYEFKIKYAPDYGELVFGGSIALLMEESEKELTKNIMKEWEKKLLLPELRVPMLNIVFERCNLKALQLEEFTGLPPHVPTPRFSQSEKDGKPKEVKK